MPIDEKTEYVSVFGFIGKPELSKKTRGEQTAGLGTLEVDRSYGKAKMDTWKR